MQQPSQEQVKLKEYIIKMNYEKLIEEFFADSIDDETFCKNHEDYYNISGTIIKKESYVVSQEQQIKEEKMYEMEKKIDERYDKIHKNDKITSSKPAFLSSSLGNFELPEKEKNRRGILAHSADELDKVKKQEKQENEKKKKSSFKFFKGLSKSADKKGKAKKEGLISDASGEATASTTTTNTNRY